MTNKLTILNSFTMPAEDETFEVTVSDIKSLAPNCWLWNESVGYLEVVKYSLYSDIVTVKNLGRRENAKRGTEFPTCMEFLITAPTALDPYNPLSTCLAADFNSPTVGQEAYMSVGSTYVIKVDDQIIVDGDYRYAVTQIVNATTLKVRNEGLGKEGIIEVGCDSCVPVQVVSKLNCCPIPSGDLTSNTSVLTVNNGYDVLLDNASLTLDTDLSKYDNSSSEFITLNDVPRGTLNSSSNLIGVSGGVNNVLGNITLSLDTDLSKYNNTNSAFITVDGIPRGELYSNTNVLTVNNGANNVLGNIELSLDKDLSKYNNTTSAFITLSDIPRGSLTSTTQLISITGGTNNVLSNISMTLDTDLSKYDNTTSGFLTPADKKNLTSNTSVLTVTDGTGATLENTILELDTDLSKYDNSTSGFITSVDGSNLTSNSALLTINNGTGTTLKNTSISLSTDLALYDNSNSKFLSESSLPTIGDGILTIQQDGQMVGSFSANSISDVTIDIPGGGSFIKSTTEYPIYSGEEYNSNWNAPIEILRVDGTRTYTLLDYFILSDKIVVVLKYSDDYIKVIGYSLSDKSELFNYTKHINSSYTYGQAMSAYSFEDCVYIGWFTRRYNLSTDNYTNLVVFTKIAFSDGGITYYTNLGATTTTYPGTHHQSKMFYDYLTNSLVFTTTLSNVATTWFFSKLDLTTNTASFSTRTYPSGFSTYVSNATLAYSPGAEDSYLVFCAPSTSGSTPLNFSVTAYNLSTGNFYTVWAPSSFLDAGGDGKVDLICDEAHDGVYCVVLQVYKREVDIIHLDLTGSTISSPVIRRINATFIGYDSTTNTRIWADTAFGYLSIKIALTNTYYVLMLDELIDTLSFKSNLVAVSKHSINAPYYSYRSLSGIERFTGQEYISGFINVTDDGTGYKYEIYSWGNFDNTLDFVRLNFKSVSIASPSVSADSTIYISKYDSNRDIFFIVLSDASTIYLYAYKPIVDGTTKMVTTIDDINHIGSIAYGVNPHNVTEAIYTDNIITNDSSLKIFSSKVVPGVAEGAYSGTDLGSTTYRWRTIYSVNSLNTSCDVRIKDNITDLEYALDTINDLDVKSYTLKGSCENISYGIIAQDVREKYPELVSVPHFDGDFYGLYTSNVLFLAVRAIQELSSKVDELNAKIKLLEGKL